MADLAEVLDTVEKYDDYSFLHLVSHAQMQLGGALVCTTLDVPNYGRAEAHLMTVAVQLKKAFEAIDQLKDFDNKVKANG